MTCQELEPILCDFLDGSLRPDERAAVQAHLTGCAECSELASDSSAVMEFLQRVPAIEPPPALVTRILNLRPAPVVIEKPQQRSLFYRLVGRWMEPVLQPRMVMGMAMTILSFAMLGRFAGIEARQLRPADLDPVKILEAAEDRAHRSWNQMVKYYESLRIVFEVQSRLRELSDNEETAPAQGKAPEQGRQQEKQQESK
jgi:anti-sigma factor RsiW